MCLQVKDEQVSQVILGVKAFHACEARDWHGYVMWTLHRPSRDQYPFSKAREDQKAELLKDVLGMANAWGRSEAYILIGVEEVRGGRSIVTGIPAAEHLADHSLQQFVNNLTNKPLRFRYEAFPFEDKQVGIVRVERQPRPVYLKRNLGRLRKNEVYVRRGSSTDPTNPATPDEIADMGRDTATLAASLSGLALELDYNKKLAVHLGAVFGKYTQEHGLGTNVPRPNPIPPDRFRLQAVEAHLRRPVLLDVLPTTERYWEIGHGATRRWTRRPVHGARWRSSMK